MVGTPLNKAYFEDLGESGMEWTRECLVQGSGISQLVISRNLLNEGKTYIAIAVEEHKDAVANNKPLSRGNINQSAIDCELQLAMLSDKLINLEKQYASLTVIVEASALIPGMKHHKIPNAQLYRYKDKYYYVQKVHEIKKDKSLGLLLNQSIGYPLNAFVVPSNEVLINPDELKLEEKESLDRIASGVIGIISAAYDGETYTLWLRYK